MYGRDVNSLVVYVYDMSTGTQRQVWTMSGNKGDQWFNTTVFPGNVKGPFSVGNTLTYLIVKYGLVFSD